MSKVHYNELDICKGIAIAFVLLSHSFIHHPIELCNISWCHYCLDVIASFFLPLFFVVSGFLFSFTNYEGYINFLKKKVIRLLLPYLTYGVANLVIKLCFPDVINRKMESLFDYFISYLLYGGEFWFVYVLLLLFIIWPPILSRIRSFRGIIILCIFFLLIWQFVPGDFLGGIFLYPQLFKYSLYFLIGYCINDSCRELLRDNRTTFTLALSFLFVNVLFVQQLNLGITIITLLVAIVGSFFFWSLSFKIENIPFLAKYLTFVGKYSLAFYFFNGFTLVPSRIFVVRLLHVTNPIIIVPLVFVLCVIGCSIAVLIIRPFPKLSKYVGI